MKNIDPKAVNVFFLTSLVPWVGSVLLPVTIFYFVIPMIPESIGVTPNHPEMLIKRFIGFIWLAPLISLLFAYMWARLTYSNYTYEIKSNGIYKASGIFFRNEVELSYDKIQNVIITRGPLDRMFGLSDIHIETAGGSGNIDGVGAGMYGLSSIDPSSLLEMSSAEMVITGLDKDEAEQIRAQIMERSKKQTI